MAREQWFVDGYELTQGLVRDLEFRAGLYRTPGVEGSDANVSNRTGRVWRPKVYGPGSFTLALWLGDSTRDQAEALYEQLLRAVMHPHRLSVWRRTLSDGTSRECDGEVTAAVEPTPIGHTGMRMGLQVGIPSGFWRGTVTRTIDSVPMAGTILIVSLTDLARSTAPMERLTYRVTGPITNPRLADYTEGVQGDWVEYLGVLAAGQTITFFADTWDVQSSGFTHDPTKVNYSGRRLLTVNPARLPGQVPRVRLTGTAADGATLRVTGAEAYLT